MTIRTPTTFRTLLLGLILGLPAFSAIAHTGLTASTPANGAVLDAGPAALELQFSSPVKLMMISLDGGDGGKIPLGHPAPAAAQSDFRLPLPPLGPGTYRATWAVMGGDAHKMTGTVEFTVGGSGASEDHGDHSGH